MESNDSGNGRDNTFDPSRRRLLAGLAATTAGAAGVVSRSSQGAARTEGLPDPGSSDIDHIVVVMMENRSFDHYLGWVPGANGIQQGLSFKDTTGQAYSTFALSSTGYGYQGCGYADPDHSYGGGRTEYDNGAMDGFLLTQPAGDQFPIGYYTRNDVLFYSGCADNWTICDTYHTGILSCTLPNRMYMHAGQTDRLSNTLTTSTLPTIWDALLAANVPCRYYYSDTPILALWGDKYTKEYPISFKLQQFVTDFSASGTPPAVSYIDPYMGYSIAEALGTAWDDHPYSDIRDGQCFLNYIYNVLRSSPVWDKTLLVINYDEWGGFFDHVPPPVGPVSTAEAALGNDGRLGIRVPCVLIGPRARRGYVEHTQFDPNAILNMIGWRFGVTPPGVRADWSSNVALALDFDDPPNTSAPVFNVSYDGKTGPFPLSAPFTPPSDFTTDRFGGLCIFHKGAEQPEIRRRHVAHVTEVQEIQNLGRAYGFKI